MAGSSLELKALFFYSGATLYIMIWKTCCDIRAAAYLVSGSSNGFRESKEGEGQVHEAILERLQLLVSLDNFDELQAHQAHHCGRGCGDGRNDLASYQFALDWIVMSTSVMKKKKRAKELFKSSNYSSSKTYSERTPQ